MGEAWVSGTFGCVRSEGWRLHEGLDIRSVERDENGEPTDPVLATADGTVVYCNRKAGLSNYGQYMVIQHRVDGIDVYSLYAHLSQIRADLKAGASVVALEPIGVMGRTTNTAQRISKERAHVHFELNLLINDRFEEWWNKFMKGSRNDHGKWNGRNLVALNPLEILLLQQRQGKAFSLVNYLREQTELCRVLVPRNDFSWLHHYPCLIRRNPVAETEGIVAYEMALTFNGLPFLLIPRAQSELDGPNRIRLLSVNESFQKDHPCGRLVVRSGQWQLTARGKRWLEKLIY